jgi:hypothetical protein
VLSAIGQPPTGAANARVFMTGLFQALFRAAIKGLFAARSTFVNRFLTVQPYAAELRRSLPSGNGAAPLRMTGLLEASFMYEMITEFFQRYAFIDSESLAVLFVMIGWAALLLHLGLESRLITAMFVPSMLAGGLIAFALVRNGYLTVFYSNAKEMQAVVISAAGITAGFLLTVFAIQVVHWVREWRRPITLEDRVQPE